MPPKSCARSRASAASCAAIDAILEIAIGQHGLHQRGDLPRIARVVQHAAAVHRHRHGRGRVGEDRHALVERFDQRHAEAFVLAGAEKQIRDVVERRQLFVRHLSEDVDIVHAQPRDELMELREVRVESAVRPRDDEPRVRGCRASCTRGSTGSDCPDACWARRARRTARSSTRRRTRRARGCQAGPRDDRSPARRAAPPFEAKPAASSSWRLNSESPSARSTRDRYASSSRRP